MGMPVQHQIAARRVDRLGQQVAAEERVDLRRLAVQGVPHRGVMKERDANVGREAVQACAQRRSRIDGDADEPLHLGLTELGRGRPREPAAEPSEPGDPETGSGEVKDVSLALQDDDADILQTCTHEIGLIGMQVVVPEDRDHGDSDPLHLIGEDLRFFFESGFRQIAREQERVNVLGDLHEGGPERPFGVRADVQIAGGGDPDHVTRSSPPEAGSVGTIVRLSICRSGNRSRATSVTAARRSSVGTVPEITTRPPAMLTSSSCSITRGSVARACRSDSSR